MLKKILSFFSSSKIEAETINPFKVWFDDDMAWVKNSANEVDSIQWSSLIGVAIETTDAGPFVDDVFFHLASHENMITYPSESEGASEMLNRLQDIPTFNNERLVEAIACHENQTFILWDHKGLHK